jgi:hypothetical protein
MTPFTRSNVHKAQQASFRSDGAVVCDTATGREPAAMVGLSDTTVTAGVLIHWWTDGGVAGVLTGVWVAGLIGEATTCRGGGAGFSRPLSIHNPLPKRRIKTAAPAIIDAEIDRFAGGTPNDSVDAEPVWAETVVETGLSAGTSGMVISCMHRGQATRMPI